MSRPNRVLDYQRYIFHLHHFFHVHGLNLQEHYTIEYVTNMELNDSKRNTLYAATNSEIFRDPCTIYDIKIGDQDRLITHTRNTFFFNIINQL